MIDGDETPGPIAALLPLLRAYVRLNFDAELRAYESCSDVVQSLCKDLIADAPPANLDGEQMRSWLWVVVRNKVRDRVRFIHQQRRDRRRQAPLDDPGGAVEAAGLYSRIASPSQHAIGGELAAQFERAFESMSRTDRELVTLSRLVGIANDELARLFHMSPKTVSMRIHRALLSFTDQWRRSERAGLRGHD